MYKCSSIFQGLLHDELLVSNIVFSIAIEKNSGPLLWLNWFKSPRVTCFKGVKPLIRRRESLACEPKSLQERKHNY